MKRKMVLFVLSVALMVHPVTMLLPACTANAAVTNGTSGKKFNLLGTTQCIVFEPNYKAESSQGLTPGTTFAKDPYVKSAALYDAYCFMRVEIPTTEFTLSNGKTVISDAVKMLYGSKEGINSSDRNKSCESLDLQ